MRTIRALSLCMAGTLAFSIGSVKAEAAVTAGASSFASVVAESRTEAGQTGLASCLAAMVEEQTDQIVEQKEAIIAANETPVVQSEFADIGVSNISEDSYINIRSAATTESDVVGKLYCNSAVTILGTEGEWYQIHSGNCDGYIKSEYIIADNEELAKSIATRTAVVTGTGLYIRQEASAESGPIGQVTVGDQLIVTEETDTWIKVKTDNGEGYVSADYVTCKNVFQTAETIEEEKARLKKEEEARRAASTKSTKSSSSSSSSNSDTGTARTYNPPSGGSGQSVADYACQFVGNPYVYGGTSLTNGADCSGFVMSVYAAFGVSLPHSSAALRSVGYGVSTSEMQPGDIICYSGHVAIYIGNNTIVHASNRTDGIKYTSPANYKSILAVRRIF